jgi:large subunit ribosomal protein L3
MGKGLLGRKLGMTQIFDDAGNVVPVTLIEAGPCAVLQIKQTNADGYDAVQLGFADRPRRAAKRPHRGHVAKANTEPKRFVRELQHKDTGGLELGQQLTVDELGEITHVDVIGTTKGCGFQGGMKRHHFHGKEASHGSKKNHRSLGSTGCSATPARTIKGRKMAGQMGNVRCTARNLEIVTVDKDKNLLAVRGSVPGANGGFLVIQQSKKTLV